MCHAIRSVVLVAVLSIPLQAGEDWSLPSFAGIEEGINDALDMMDHAHTCALRESVRSVERQGWWVHPSAFEELVKEAVLGKPNPAVLAFVAYPKAVAHVFQCVDTALTEKEKESILKAITEGARADLDDEEMQLLEARMKAHRKEVENENEKDQSKHLAVRRAQEKRDILCLRSIRAAMQAVEVIQKQRALDPRTVDARIQEEFKSAAEAFLKEWYALLLRGMEECMWRQDLLRRITRRGWKLTGKEWRAPLFAEDRTAFLRLSDGFTVRVLDRASVLVHDKKSSRRKEGDPSGASTAPALLGEGWLAGPAVRQWIEGMKKKHKPQEQVDGALRMAATEVDAEILAGCAESDAERQLQDKRRDQNTSPKDTPASGEDRK